MYIKTFNLKVGIQKKPQQMCIVLIGNVFIFTKIDQKSTLDIYHFIVDKHMFSPKVRECLNFKESVLKL